MGRLSRVVVAALLGASPSLAVAPPAAAQDAPTKTLRVALREDADQLDPTLGRTYVGRIVFAGLCDKLFDIDESLAIVPQLATGYEWADSRALLVHLRPGVLFHDGTPMDAAAVKYSLERHMTMQGSTRRGELASVDHVEVVDPATVRLVLKSPNVPLLAVLTDRAGMMVSPKAAEAAGKDFALHPVCAGPFRFAERVPQDRIVLDRFAQYWNAGAIHFARVVYQPIVDSTARLANLQAGSIDLSEQILPTDVETVRKNPKLRIVTSEALGYQVIDINVGRGPRQSTPMATDARVRHAFELSLDRAAMIQVVYNGMYTPNAQAISPGSPYHDKDVVPPERDVAGARALLAAAGVKAPVPVTMMVPNNPDLQQMGEVIQAMAGEAGFEVKLRATEFASALDAAERGDYQIFLEAWSGRADPDGNLWNFLHSGAPLNYAGYSNAQVDGWLEEGRTITDLAQRRAVYARVVAQVARDLPELYLYTPKNIVGMSAKLSGFVPVADGMVRIQGMRTQ